MWAVAWADTVNPQLTMPVGLTTYAVKFAVLGVVLVAFSDSTWPGLHPMSWGGCSTSGSVCRTSG